VGGAVGWQTGSAGARTGDSDLPACRFCGGPLQHTFVDLGMSPLCESYLDAAELNHMERFYPLHARLCERCWLVQLQEYVAPQEIFSEYAYFSSYSDTWVAHAQRFAESAIARFGLGVDSLVIEVGSNDGYLLQHFATDNVPVLGIDPAANVAAAAEARGVQSRVAFFGAGLARELAAARGRADLLIANNVLAQVPSLNDFVDGLAQLLAPKGTLCIEVPHLLRLVEGNQFDTIYHEHFSYFSLYTLERVLAQQRLIVFAVDELPTHGGSLRLYVKHAANAARRIEDSVRFVRDLEWRADMTELDFYRGFGKRVAQVKRGFLRFLIDAREHGQTVVGYGAPGKGNTLLNYCGIRSDLIDYTVDRNPYKQGKFLPGTHLPIYHPAKIEESRPDFVVILPWNLKEEIAGQMTYIKEWGGAFVVAIPSLQVF
jgi:SAM-dependent methyltransferase